MTNLKTIEGFNIYCGPAVLASITGRSTDECAAVIGRINGKYNVTGVYISDLLKAADRLGFDCKKMNSGGSLYATIVRLVPTNGVYIVELQTHYVVLEVNNGKVYFCDNHTKEPIPAASSARLTQAVVSSHKITKREDTLILEPQPKPKPKPEPEYVTVISYKCKECCAMGDYPSNIIHYNFCSHSEAKI